MNEKNERNLDSTVDEIMEEIREQNVSEVKDINEKEQKSEDRGKRKSLKQNVLQAITYLAMVWIIKQPQAKIDRLRKRLRAGKRK